MKNSDDVPGYEKLKNISSAQAWGNFVGRNYKRTEYWKRHVDREDRSDIKTYLKDHKFSIGM
jgi:hypothetical protein